MRLAIASDIHLGDPHCTLVVPTRTGFTLGPLYGAFVAATGGELDYLVLAGDVLEIMLSSYEDAYKAARVFFRQLQADRIAREVVFIAGNHDFEIWHTVEHEVNVINRIKSGQDPRPFRWSVPGVIDDRRDAMHRGLRLPDVHARDDEAGGRYGALFLDSITMRADGSGEPLPFAFVYPNLYVVTASGESVLVTHGHYLESYWSLLSALSMRIARDDLALDPRSRTRERLSMRELVAINFPLTQLTSSGLGQSGPLSRVVNHLQRDVEGDDFARIDSMLARLLPVLAEGTPWYLDRLVKMAGPAVRGRLVRSLRDYQGGCYADDLRNHAGTRARFLQFIDASLDELDRLLEEHGLHVPFPRRLISGHTHQPLGWNDGRLTEPRTGITLHNSGGWVRLRRGDEDWRFPGAEVFRYSTERGFDSVSIAVEPSIRSAA